MFTSPPKVKFIDFWKTFRHDDHYLWNVMKEKFAAVYSDEPDYLFYAIYPPFEHGLNARYDRCIKILWTPENIVPDYRACDYALSFEYSNDPRNLRWPLYVTCLRSYLKSLIQPTNLDVNALLASKTKFCNFVYSDPRPQERLKFMKLLSKYKRVDSGGMIENNLGYKVADKLKFISEYKFTIAFENTSHDGYVTEKIVEPLSVHSVPIYWGSPRITDDFEPGCFVNCHDHASLEEVVERIVTLDRDDSLFTQYLGAPRFKNNTPNIYCQPDYLIQFLAKIFQDRTPRARKEMSGEMLRKYIDQWKICL
jgi:alpha(1,3/1,4) fucosyltransferase